MIALIIGEKGYSNKLKLNNSLISSLIRSRLISSLIYSLNNSFNKTPNNRRGYSIIL